MTLPQRPRLSPLPIDDALPTIVAALRERRSLVLVAEPGAGKTTRVPPGLLDAGLAEGGEILVLEPRRLATRMAARRVAQERGERLGDAIGFQVRFDEVAGPNTRVRFLTEGILTRRFATDPTLRGVSAVILDEFHERSLHADLALTWLRHVQRTARPDLRLCVMSATLDAEPVAAFLGCEVVRVPGRMFDVAVEFADAESDRYLDVRVTSAVRKLVARGLDGDVLVFLPGAGEIRRCKDALAEVAREANLLVLPLHGDLPPAEQDRAVAPADRRKVILSTNIAETSLTIDGVTAVIDSGLCRLAKHSPWSGLPSLTTVKVSRASATQRTGRAGRTRPGVCIRLYTKHDLDTRPAHDVPEIRRSDLCETLLALRAAGARDPRQTQWFEAPPAAAVDAAERLLARLGAVDGAGAVTELGRRLLSLPLHPRIGRLFVEAEARGAGRHGALLAALLGERELRLSARTSFRDDAQGVDDCGPSDLLARLGSFEAVEHEGISADRCRRHGLDFGAVSAVARARDALVRRLRSREQALSHAAVDEALLIATLCGFPDRVAKRRKERAPEVVFAGGGSARIGPMSVVHDAPLMVVVEAEEGRGGVTARLCSAILPEWLLDLFPEAIADARTVRFEPAGERVEVTSALTYEGLSLEESRIDAVGADVAAALADAALQKGAASFCAEGALERLLLRLRFAAAHKEGFPVFDDAMIRATLVELCEGLRTFKELRERSLLSALEARLSSQQRGELARLAPETFTLPGGRRLHIAYEPDKPPWAESRLQDFFGMREGPRVAAGKVAVVLHLNAPNGRAQQVTTDLSGFWDRHYPAIRKELMRRYPRHSWPEEPRTAEPPKPSGRR